MFTNVIGHIIKIGIYCIWLIWQCERTEKNLPSWSASQTSSVVTFSAFKSIDKFCAFFGSIICTYCVGGPWGEASVLISLFFPAGAPNSDSIISSSNLVRKKQCFFLELLHCNISIFWFQENKRRRKYPVYPAFIAGSRWVLRKWI